MENNSEERNGNHEKRLIKETEIQCKMEWKNGVYWESFVKTIQKV